MRERPVTTEAAGSGSVALALRHGLVMSGKPREPGYRLEDCSWVAKRVRSSVKKT
jgi:hypothetical protein